MIKKKDLRKRLENLEGQVRKLEFEKDGYKNIAQFYANLGKTDGGHFARTVMKDMKIRIKNKKYKPVNYQMAKILRKIKQTYPKYTEDILLGYLEEYEDFND